MGTDLHVHVFDWQETLWSINFCSHGGMVGTIVIGFASVLSIVD